MWASLAEEHAVALEFLDTEWGLQVLSYDNMKNTLCDVFFLYSAKSRQEKEK